MKKYVVKCSLGYYTNISFMPFSNDINDACCYSLRSDALFRQKVLGEDGDIKNIEIKEVKIEIIEII